MRVLLSLVAFVFAGSAFGAEPVKLKVLFLGDNAGHRPADRFKQLQPVFAKRGIELTYTDKLDDLNAKNLSTYDALLIYANHTKISAEQEKALLEYVEGGKGFVPVHCASYCFLNSPKYIEMVGAQFRSHGTGTFTTEVVKGDHEITKGFKSFKSYDETYVHTKHNEKGRTVLEVRAEGELKEPWTWVREQGRPEGGAGGTGEGVPLKKGRVFYTAWGHDQRTWGHPGFHNLLERGVLWACGKDPALAGTYTEPLNLEKPEMTKIAKDAKPFEYVDAKVPFYPARGEKAGPLSKMQKPLSTEESMKHISTPVDFELKVFVTEKDLGGKPIAMAWDEQGRLFVSITVDYPNEMQPPGQGRDKIVMCEDTNGDGVCDKITVFADKLSIASSVLPYAGGLIVHQAPVTLFLKDTNGDGVADARQELFRGWSTGDTHAGPSNLHYGFDNWIYGSVGYAGFNGTVGGEKHNFRQGFYRFKVERSKARDDFGDLKVTKLEFLRSTSNNTWGLCFDESGELFGSTANGCPFVHMAIPNRYYEKVKGLTPTVLQNIAQDNHIEPITEKVRQVDWHGGFTAASNCSIYTARTYPREYWNRTAFISEPTGHLTATMTFEPSGTSFKARYGWNLVASDDEWCAPIDAQVGPDGHMWVIDWYAFIVQHNPTPAGFKNGRGNAYETELRDKSHGRIYRVVYKKAPVEKPFTLKDATPEKLVEALKHPNMTWRLHAQRLLLDRGKDDVVPALMKLMNDEKADETGLNAGVVHALWTFRDLARKEFELASELGGTISLLGHRSAAVRKAAVLTLPAPSKVLCSVLLQIMIGRKETDPRETDPQVLVALAQRIAEITPNEENGTLDVILAILLSEDNDQNLKNALLAASAVRAGNILSLVAWSTREPTASGLATLEALARHYGTTGADDQLSRVLEATQRKEANSKAALAIVNGLAAGWPSGKTAKLTPDAEKAVFALLPKLPAASRGRLLKLASTWGVKGIDEQLAAITKAAFATLADAKAKDADRVTAAQQVVEFQPDSPDAADKLLAAVTSDASPALANGIFLTLEQSKAKAVGVAVVAKLRDLPPAVRPAALRLVLAKTDSAKAFLDAVEKGTLRFDMLALDQRTALASHQDKEVAARATKLLAQGGGLPNADRQKVIEELKDVLAKGGNVENGKKMFVAHCAKCHKHGAEGATVGPDLTGFGVHPREEMMIAILDPSRSVEGNFKLYRVTTADDRTVLGILGAQTGTSVEIIDAEAKRHTLSKEDIVSMKETDKSLMPEGFEKIMKPEEMADLLEFLGQKGKYVPLPLDKIATVITTKDMFFDAGGQTERLIFPDWKPKVFEGVPFVLVDPMKDTVKNAVMLNGPQGKIPPLMPKSVSLSFNGKAKAIHLLSGISGWGALDADTAQKTVSMIVRLTYDDGKTEDHELKNGVHFADYIRRVDVPESKFAFALRTQQLRYLAVTPKRPDAVVKTIEFVKGPDRTAPIVMAVTVESP
jgi:uncharacterized protein